MEEILASIRRIISEDDAPPPAPPEPAPATVAAAPEPEPEPVAAPEPEPEPLELADDGVLELTERVEAVGDLDVYNVEPPPAPPEPEPVFVAPPPAPEPEPAPPPPPAPTQVAAPVFAAAPIAGLSGSTTIEELVRAILEPQIKAWADANMSTIVDGIVREQIQAKLGQVFK